MTARVTKNKHTHFLHVKEVSLCAGQDDQTTHYTVTVVFPITDQMFFSYLSNAQNVWYIILVNNLLSNVDKNKNN